MEDPDLADAHPHAAEDRGPATPSGRLPALALIATLALAAAVRAYRIDDPFGGYHGYNEAFYANHARAYLARPLLDPFVHPRDFNNPPFFPLLLRQAFAWFGMSEATARLVPLVASVATVAVAGRLAAALLGPATGLLTALFLAVCPAAVLVGRNVQVDMVALLFTLAFLDAWVRGSAGTRARPAVVAGVCLGLAALTKQPTALALIPAAAWSLAGPRQPRALVARFAVMLGAAAVVAGSWYGSALLLHGPAFVSSQHYLVSTFAAPDAHFWSDLFARELWWGWGPPIAVLAAAGLALAAVRRAPGTVLVLSGFVTFAVFYVFFHAHTYYLILAMPFGVMAAAWVVARVSTRPGVLAAAGAAVALATLAFTAIVMCGQKYGYTEFREVGARLAAFGPKRVVYAHPHLLDNFGTLIDWYHPGTPVRVLTDSVLASPPDSAAMVTYAPDSLPVDPERHGIYRVGREVVTPVMFGFALAEQPPNLHRFTIGSIRATRVGGLAAFGFRSARVPGAFVVVDMDRAKGR